MKSRKLLEKTLKLLSSSWKLNRMWKETSYRFLVILQIAVTLISCAGPIETQELSNKKSKSLPTLTSNLSPTEPNPQSSAYLSQDQIETLKSLKKVDDYPLYIMHYTGSYSQFRLPSGVSKIEDVLLFRNSRKVSTDWGCSLFAALADPKYMHFGRNFDWDFSPALLLFTNPPDGFASVSTVDIAYLGFSEDQVRSLTDLPLSDREVLLSAPNWPFDGMNEHGLAIGMAAVPKGDIMRDPNKERIGSLQIIRKILDKAANVEQAVSIFESYNIEFDPGPALHYLIADSSGEAILVEFYEGRMNLIPKKNPWHQATNFLLSSVDEPQGYCSRYDKITNEMLKTGGRLPLDSSFELLADVSQINTQWSVLYQMSSGKVNVVMGNNFDQVYQFQLFP